MAAEARRYPAGNRLYRPPDNSFASSRIVLAETFVAPSRRVPLISRRRSR